MIIRLLSYNVRDLSKAKKRIQVKAFMRSLPYPLDFMVGQEHKLRAHNIHLLQSIWPSAKFIVAPIVDRAHVERNASIPAGCSGVFLAIGPKWQQFITSSRTLQSKRACWAHLEPPLLGRLGVIAVYAPNVDSERARLWHKIADYMEANRKWFFVGDFNNVEALADRRGGSVESWLEEKKGGRID